MQKMSQIAIEVKDEIRGQAQPCSKEDTMKFAKLFFEADIAGKKHI